MYTAPRTHVAILGLLLWVCPIAAQSAMYVYELPDGSRMVTDHRLDNPRYRLVRTGATAGGLGSLVAAKHPQFFRADPSAYDSLIARVAQEHRVDFALVKAVMHVESAFNPFARSHKGALGLMQLMPDTARQYGIEDIHDPVQNVVAGVKHLRYLLDTFKHRQTLALAAYNAGEGAVLRHRGIPPYRETREYVKKVLQFKREYSRKS